MSALVKVRVVGTLLAGAGSSEPCVAKLERLEDLEAQPRQGDGLEIVRVGKEGEHFVARAREPKLGVVGSCFHCG